MWITINTIHKISNAGHVPWSAVHEWIAHNMRYNLLNISQSTEQPHQGHGFSWSLLPIVGIMENIK